MDVHFVSGEDGDKAFIKSMTGCLSVSSVLLEEKREGEEMERKLACGARFQDKKERKEGSTTVVFISRRC